MVSRIEAFGIVSWINLFLKIVQRLPVTLIIMISSLFFGLLLGVVVAIIRIRKSPIPYVIATFYLSFTRCTPALVQLFLIFYGLPTLLMLINIDINNWDKIIFVIITFSLHSAAFLSEVIRSAYIAVGNNQIEAAYSVGMNYTQALKRIILPQAFRIALPNLGNSLISLLKETSLAFTIGIIDIMGQVRIILGNNYGANMFEVYIIVSLIYWIICLTIERCISYMEKTFNRGHISISK